ncbi:MAG TPA: alpha-2-macroglobulin family protein [Acidobacteriota bacterium]|nr:alpha-2-macroglobulin family protein [Acidobacteriota bacterium]HQM62861.1 alpha-2-macroglobulin family protein [Acidobacteriota bacterium]
MRSNTKEFSMWAFILMIGCVLLFGIACDAADGRSRKALWDQVAQAEADGLPETAATLLGQIYDGACRDGADVEALRALVKKILMESVTGGNHPEEKVRRLQAALPRAPERIQPLLRVILAQWYDHYYQRNRYRFLNRDATAKLDEQDFTTWDLPRLFREMDALYQSVLADEERLRRIPTADFREFLEPGNMPNALRPTLFDFIADQAIVFYTSNDTFRPKPQDAFEITADSDVLAPAAAFVQWQPTTTDTESPLFKALQLFQRILRVHAQDADPAARRDADLRRLHWARNVAAGETAAERFIERLQELAESAGDDVSALARYYWARELQSQEAFTAALAVAEAGAETAPKSVGGANCRSLITTIRQPAYQLQAETVTLPERPWHVRVTYRNVTALTFRIYPVPLPPSKELYREQQPNTEELDRLLRGQPLWEIHKTLPPTTDYKETVQDVELPGLAPGFYRVLASYDKAFRLKENAIAHTTFWSSPFGVVLRARGERIEGHALGNATGRPLAGVAVTAYAYDYAKRAYTQTGAATTDANGYFFIQPGENRRDQMLFFRAPDGTRYLHDDSVGYARVTRAEAVTRTVLFTDRSLYRPGQMIHFKGLCIETDPGGGSYRVLPRRAVTLAFRDVNDQEIAKTDFVTNDFGSFSGTWTAPTGRLLGAMRLVTADPPGSATLRVEEYKRPKFFVELKPPDGECRLGDAVTVTGEAQAYAGAPIDGASVRYRVVRLAQLPPWFYYYRDPRWRIGEPQEIASGTLTTDAAGGFRVTFAARPDKKIPAGDNPTFVYRIQVDVTDTAGETRSGERVVRLGYTALQADIAAAEWQESIGPIRLNLRTTTLDGEPAPATGTLTVFKLQMPDAPVPAELFGARRDAGETASVRTAEWQRWPAGDQALSREFATGADGTLAVDLALPPGVYRAQLHTQDRYGSPVRAMQPLLVLDPAARTFPVRTPAFFGARPGTVEPGDSFEAFWATGYVEGPALVEIFSDGEWLQQYWIHPQETQHRISYPVTERHRGGFTVVTTFVKENRLYTTTTRVAVPWTNKALRLEWGTFRSKLRPGQAETWSLKVSGPSAEAAAAELVATLYDASLDQFYPHGFPGLSGFFRQDRTYIHPFFSTKGQGLRMWEDEFRRYAPYEEPLYLRFPADVTNNYFMYEMRRTMAEAPSMMAGAPMPPPAPAPAAKMAAPGEAEAADASAAPADASAQPAPPPTGPVQLRTNLNETAFFFPQLEAGADGSFTLNFTMPEALTRWRFLSLAHTRELASGALTDEVVTQKELMVQPNPPRFLREGDELEFSVKVINLTDNAIEGGVTLNFLDAFGEQSLDGALSNATPDQACAIPAKQSRSFAWRIKVPGRLDLVTYRAVARAGEFSDGEEGLLPVISRRILVQESLPLWISGQGEKAFRFDKLLSSGASDSLAHLKLVLQMVSNPAWYAVQALPFLMEFPYECSEQVFNRLYANALGHHIAHANPRIRKVLDAWRTAQPEALASNLEKNTDLRSVLLEESPWVLDARDETQARRNTALFFDENRIQSELASALRKLEQMQLPDGSWPWFPGGRGNSYITLYLVTGFGRLKHLGVQAVPQEMALKAVDHLDGWIVDVHKEIIKNKRLRQNNLTPTAAMYLYARSFYLEDKPLQGDAAKAALYFLKQGETHWLKLDSRRAQAQLALAEHRFGGTVPAMKILRSLKERSQVHPELGRYWAEGQLSWWWYHAPIETQALMIEAFDEVARDVQTVEECKIWLLKQKQTQNWKTTTATADAVYALLRRGEDWLAADALVGVTLGGQRVEPDTVEAGTGCYEKRWSGPEIRPEMGEVKLEKTDPGIAWGGLHWQYLEDIGRITPYAGTPLQLQKALFVRRDTKQGPVIEPVAGPLAVGDLVVVRVTLRVDRDMEYVHMKDHRGSGFEPADVLSGYRFQDGLFYYQSTRDTATHFFIDYLPVGTYIFEYNLRVTHKGRYPTGLAHIECMYAPEFNSHSASVEVEVR